MGIESALLRDGSQEKKDLMFYDKERAIELVYSNFLLGRLNEEEICELLAEIDAFDEALDKETFQAINELSSGIKSSIENIESDDWKEELSGALDKIETLDIKDKTEIRYARSFITHHLYSLMMKYRESGKSLHNFAEDVRAWMESVDKNIPDIFEDNDEVIINKRQPGFRESVEETLRRYEVIEKIIEEFNGQVEGIIFGGSMSYGPFYNVRGDRDKTGASDLDSIIIINDDTEKISLTDIFEESDAAQFLSRFKEFKELHLQGVAQIMTQKFRLKKQNFDVSVHFFTEAEFEKLVGKLFEDNLKRGDDMEHIISDYRASEFPHAQYTDYNFDGSTFKNTLPKGREVSEGVINSISGYSIRGGKYFPSVYQNVISPSFDVWYDRTGETTQQVDNLRKSMTERMEFEQAQKPDVKFENSHLRHRIFSSHFKEKINQKEQ